MHSGSRDITRRSFLGMQALALAAILASCSDAEDTSSQSVEPTIATLDEIRSSGGFVNVGIHTDNCPLGFINKRGNYSGLDHYFCLFFAEKNGLGVRYASVDPCNRYDSLLSGLVDFCIAETSPSDSGVEGVIFTKPLYTLQLGLASSASSPVESIDQLVEGSVAVCRGSYSEHYAEMMWPDVSLRRYNTLSSARTALENGQCVAFLDDEIAAAAWLKGRDDFALTMKGIGEPREVAVAVTDNQTELFEALQETVESFLSGAYVGRAYDTIVKPEVGDTYRQMLCLP
ncbi:MAG: transporter substrate-binding domain-containing protein [Atopobiaceae bacterium]|nr:transporter substrate-binding domain-containing protein [Atopobiaceae bacterium]MBQ6524426.1 transporter substrate-binding domain-containing protein [Atopobiaceae bacterium]